MAQQTKVILTCDLETAEKPATETIGFTFEGTPYEIDLCDKHAKQLRDAMGPFVSSARRVTSRGSGRRRGRATTSGGSDRERTQAIREWARKKGIAVSERGRLPADVIAQYHASER